MFFDTERNEKLRVLFKRKREIEDAVCKNENWWALANDYLIHQEYRQILKDLLELL